MVGEVLAAGLGGSMDAEVDVDVLPDNLLLLGESPEVFMLRLRRKLEIAFAPAPAAAGEEAGGVDIDGDAAGSPELLAFGVTGAVSAATTRCIEGIAPGNWLRFGLDMLIAGDAGLSNAEDDDESAAAAAADVLPC